MTRASRRAHPRAGGENPRSHSTRHEQKGSSPRGRGKPALSCRPRGDRRLIPARAGKTSVNGRTACARTAHPRAGGENVVAETKNFSRAGSSPRGRGKRRPSPITTRAARLIPARAGKTSRTSMSSCSAPAHPRAGGENWNHSTTTETAAGSSPRGRGKPVMSTTDSAVTVAHPRAGGENAIRATVRKSQDGSSPRGRGKLDQLRECFENAGLIPARAGKTQARRLTFSLRRAHPRAGGENPVGGAFPDRSGGSSPRGRGKPDPAHHDPARAGLIPARAGKTTAGKSPPPSS